jgi:hypothetical protein
VKGVNLGANPRRGGLNTQDGVKKSAGEAVRRGRTGQHELSSLTWHQAPGNRPAGPGENTSGVTRDDQGINPEVPGFFKSPSAVV